MSEMISFLPGLGGAAITTLQVLTFFTQFQNEKNPETRTPYSKFAKDDAPSSKDAPEKRVMISSRNGMMIIYTPALLLSGAVLSCGGSNVVTSRLPAASPAAMLCAVHFAKRVLEVLFVHRYSGRVTLGISSAIGSYYTLLSLLICSVAKVQPSETMLQVGTGIFIIGLLGNFYHHYLLARLRAQGDNNTTQKRYVVPSGGMFNYVAAPHYLFELIGWFGMSMVASHGNVYLLFISMCSYLGGRSVAQNEFNKLQFPTEWPISRKNIIPFLF